jgi:hypothetical protein
MTTMISEVYEALKDAGASEKSRQAAEALSKRDGDVTDLKSDVRIIKWMMGSVLAFQLAIFVKMFIK